MMIGRDRANGGKPREPDVDADGAVLLRFGPDSLGTEGGLKVEEVGSPGLGDLLVDGALPVDGSDVIQPVEEQNPPACFDDGAQRALVEQRNNFTNITSATTTTPKSASGFLKSITINKAVANGVITIYDNTGASGTKIGTITFGAALLNDPPWTADYCVAFVTGLTIVTSAATDITVAWR